MTQVARKVLPRSFVERFTADLSRRLLEAAGPGIELGFDHVPRRDELNRLVDGVEQLPLPARRDFGIAVHPDQVRSKLWLIDELARHCILSTSTPVVLGAWYGILPVLINWRLARPPSLMLCIDVDPAVCEIGANVIASMYPNIEYRVADLTQLDYDELVSVLESPVIINTSCEHVAELDRWWTRLPADHLVVVQSNNFRTCPEHVNCVDRVGELQGQTPMETVLFEGVLHLPLMDRYMLIGRR